MVTTVSSYRGPCEALQVRPAVFSVHLGPDSWTLFPSLPIRKVKLVRVCHPKLLSCCRESHWALSWLLIDAGEAILLWLVPSQGRWAWRPLPRSVKGSAKISHCICPRVGWVDCISIFSYLRTSILVFGHSCISPPTVCKGSLCSIPLSACIIFDLCDNSHSGRQEVLFYGFDSHLPNT